MKRKSLAVYVLVVGFLLAGCGAGQSQGATSTPTATSTRTFTATPSSTQTQSPTVTPTLTATPFPTSTFTPMPTATATPTSVPSATPKPKPTIVPTKAMPPTPVVRIYLQKTEKRGDGACVVTIDTDGFPPDERVSVTITRPDGAYATGLLKDPTIVVALTPQDPQGDYLFVVKGLQHTVQYVYRWTGACS
ncbi:MAG: hypothetical protein GXP41_10355 [Chloroflexi bacterium]|nr:hypothetical protein [Chloroflexota bacterium]